MDKIKEKIDPKKINIIKNIATVISIIIVLCLLFYYLTNYLELNNYSSIINKATNKYMIYTFFTYLPINISIIIIEKYIQ